MRYTIATPSVTVAVGEQPAAANERHSNAMGRSIRRRPSLPRVEVANRAARYPVDVQVGERDPDEAAPREQHVTPVEPRRALPHAVARRDAPVAGEAVDPAADQVPPRVAAERVRR